MKGLTRYYTDSDFWDQCKQNREKYNHRMALALADGEGVGKGYYNCPNEGEVVCRGARAATGQVLKGSEN